ncbi:MAG TPA: GNAT family N-acetyltransferase [Rhodanobacteraceae bacterium]
MTEHPFHIIQARWPRDMDALRLVRETVFIREQRVPVELEWDGLDERCDHVLALDAQNHPVGTGRLTPAHSIGRMAVLPAWRGHGVGAAMLRRLIERAGQHGWPQVTLHAQVDAIGFYSRFGFVAFDDEFMEAGIRHRSMALDLPASANA